MFDFHWICRRNHENVNCILVNLHAKLLFYRKDISFSTAYENWNKFVRYKSTSERDTWSLCKNGSCTNRIKFESAYIIPSISLSFHYQCKFPFSLTFLGESERKVENLEIDKLFLSDSVHACGFFSFPNILSLLIAPFVAFIHCLCRNFKLFSLKLHISG